MKMLFIALTIRLLAKAVFGEKNDNTNEPADNCNRLVRHPAEFLLR